MDGFNGGGTGESGGSSPVQPQGGTSSPAAQRGGGFDTPSISLPKGGGAIRGIGEKFGANPVTGTGSMSVPIFTSPGRSGFGPQLSLSYDSGAGNGPFGIGWNLSLPAITRKTDKGLPRYHDMADSDEFILSGAEDLVPVLKQDAQGQWLPEDVPPRTVDGNVYTIRRYRPRIEGLFARIERWTNQSDHADCCWRSISRDNITTWYGKTKQSRITDPNEPTRIFSWLICESYDDKGNVIAYHYSEEDTTKVDTSQVHEQNRNHKSRGVNRYLKHITYGNRTPFYPVLSDNQPWPALPGDAEWLFEVVLDYDQGHYEALDPDPTLPPEKQHQRVRAAHRPVPDSWTARPDPFSSYRAGFEVRTYRRCRRVLMFHRFTELGIEPCLVRSTEFDYHDLNYRNEPSLEVELSHAGSTRFTSKISAVTQSGYVHHTQKPIEEEDVQDPAGVRYVTYIKKSLPPLEFQYTQAAIQEQLQTIDPESLENLPQGLDGAQYRWADLDGEGAGGILTEQDGAWLYKRNLSPLPIKDEHGALVTTVRFAPMEKITPLPSFASLSSGQQQLLDLAGDGQVDVVAYADPTPGFFERTSEGDWQPFKAFKSLPNIEWQDPNLKFVDLTGDGHADIFITEDEAFTWYASLAEAGFSPAQKVHQLLDEEQGPRLVFNDGTQSIYLSDFSGDGLSDLVRIRNGEVCYWPNLGYCRFGAKVTIDNAPWFDAPDQFDQKRIRLADIDGTGVADILYLKHDGVRIYFNHSGNSWTKAYHLTHLPAIDNTTNVMTVDLLGNGTACLVWSSPLPGNTHAPMRYVDLMGGQKPHLLTRTVNNLGAETVVHYAPSTKFYLKDKQDGKEWITRLHFPVHVVERVETYDYISRNRFVTRYAYHHGYFDGHEREFRGFGMVEQWDTEEYAALSQSGDLPTGDNVDSVTHVPPVHTKTWFHTGAYLGRGHISDYFAGPIDQNEKGEYFREPGLSNVEARELLLRDTVLPDEITIDEESEACRALKGQMLRQEVYADDGSDNAQYPYTVTEQNFTIKRLQAKSDNPHAVFLTHARETINYHYERDPADPRTQHALTLEVDDYGNIRKSLAIGCKRRPGMSPLQGEDKNKQEQMLITYTENEVTIAIDDSIKNPDGSVKYPNDYRAPMPSEVRTYELTGLDPDNGARRFSFDELIENNFEKIRTLTEVPYEHAVDYSANRKRLIERVRTLYRSNNLQGSLALGDLESLALPYESYKLAFTPRLINDVYQRDSQPLLPTPAAVLAGTGADKGGYVDLDSDNHWWIPSGHVFYKDDVADPVADELTEAQQHFFLPRKYTNPFLHSTRVRYDNHDLLPQETIDAVNNIVTVGERYLDDTLALNGNNYRVLQTEKMMGPNRNRSAIAFDALGLVAGSAVMGKPEDNPQQGDLLEAAFSTDLTRQQIDDFENDPLGQPAFDLLGNATSRIVYDIDRFHLSRDAFPNDPTKWQAGFATTITRETHVSELPASGEFKIQVGFSYSDGFGREIQKKIQAEPGPVEGLGNNVRPRWVGSGWTIFNNKGKPVRQYEPFFSTLPDHRHRFEFARIQGVSSILFYDPVGRVVATLHPNHTYKKVLFDPWHQTTYDVNDTVTFNPVTDNVVNSYLLKADGTPRLPSNEYLPTWHQLRTEAAYTLVFEAQYPNATDRQHHTVAANKAADHADTPTTAHFDTLGRPFLTIAHNKVVCPNHALDGTEDMFRTRVELDIEGNQRAVRDADTKAWDAGGNEIIDELGRIVMHYDYDMLGNRIYQLSMEAGARWMLNDVMGNLILAWDSRAKSFRTEYDPLRRPLRTWVTGADPANLNQELLTERLVYGEQHPQALLHNLRGKLYMHLDQAGALTIESVDFKANPKQASRHLAREYKQSISWAAVNATLPSDATVPFNTVNLEAALTPLLEADTYTSHTTYDALNRPLTATSPDGSVYRPTYNEANLLEKVDVNLRGVALATPFVVNIDYDAKGQRSLIEYGSGATGNPHGVITTYDYDPLTFRLERMTITRPPNLNGLATQLFKDPVTVQDLHYTYDPVGNITHIGDDALLTIHHNGQQIDPFCNYTYDALYRLIEAAGREHIGQSAFVINPPNGNLRDFPNVGANNLNNPQALRNYTEQYVYDVVGNFKAMAHQAANGAWSRVYDYDEASLIEANKKSNRLSKTPLQSDPHTATKDFTYDPHGSMTKMPHLPLMQWDYRDQLQATAQQVVNNGTPETTWYVYDAAGQRVRKVTESMVTEADLANGDKPVRLTERIYLGGFEIYREYENDGVTPQLERESLHIIDDKQRIALVETQTIENSNPIDPPVPRQRYQFGNHLGSASLELADDGSLISYEEYHPYGTTAYQAGRSAAELSLKRYRYTGKERDEESGLYYYGARYYAPWVGRWCSADPAGLVDGTNRYVSMLNNPISMGDSSGLASSDKVHQVGEQFIYKDRSKALYEAGKRISEDEHGIPKATREGFTLNPETGESDFKKEHYKKSNVTRQSKDTADRKTRGGPDADNPRSARIKKTVRSGGKIDVNKESMGVLENWRKADTAGEITDTKKVHQILDDLGGQFQIHGQEGAKTIQPNFSERISNDKILKEQRSLNAASEAAKSQAPSKKSGKVKQFIRNAAEKLSDNPKLAKAGAKLAKAGKQFAKAIPFLGVGAGMAGAAYAVSQGEHTTAALDTFGMVPVAGDVVDAARGGYALGEAVNELVVDSDLAMEHGDVAKAAMQGIGAGETVSNIVGGVAAAGSAIGQVLLKASPVGIFFW